MPIPPSSYAALAGATVLVNLSASNITIGKADYRHRLVSLQSARCLAAYLYSSAGLGESTTDLGWDGQALIYESGDLLAESERFVTGSHFISADVDLERVSRERMRQNSFGYSVEKHEAAARARSAASPFELPVPTAAARSRCSARSSASRTCRPIRRGATSAAWRSTTSRSRRCCSGSRAVGGKKLVIGVSGGLDSTHALLVCAAAMDRARPAAQQHPRLHDARLRDQRRARSTRPSG